MVAVTRQVPAPVVVRTPDWIVHPGAVPPAVITYDTAPVPDPPEVVSVSGVPKVPDIELINSAAWLAFANVIVVRVEDPSLLLVPVVSVAVTRQVPAPVVVRTPDWIVQPCAVPPAEIANDTAPVPDPPEVVSVTGVPKGTVMKIESAVWFVLNVMVVWIEDFAL